MAKARPLSEDHKRFVAEYLIDQNGTRAYLAVYPESSYDAARTGAARLLAKANIRREIKAGSSAVQKRTHIRADTALREAARLAYSDPLYIFEDDGVTPRNIRSIPIETRRAIASVKVKRVKAETWTAGRKRVTITHDVIEFKLWPKPKGLDKLFAHLGLSQEITPLDALLASLPAGLAEEVRAALTGFVPTGGDPEGNGSQSPA